jgi:hypothetical protein
MNNSRWKGSYKLKATVASRLCVVADTLRLTCHGIECSTLPQTAHDVTTFEARTHVKGSFHHNVGFPLTI